MIVLKRAKNGLRAESSDCVYNPPMADSSQTNRSSNSRFSGGTALQLGCSTARVRLVPLDVSEYQEVPRVDLRSMGRDELIAIRRQLLQRQERSKKPSKLEVIKSKYIVRKLFLALLRIDLKSHPQMG
jgi:hypothetical protein